MYRSWRDAPEVKSTDYSFRKPGPDSQAPKWLFTMIHNIGYGRPKALFQLPGASGT